MLRMIVEESVAEIRFELAQNGLLDYRFAILVAEDTGAGPKLAHYAGNLEPREITAFFE